MRALSFSRSARRCATALCASALSASVLIPTGMASAADNPEPAPQELNWGPCPEGSMVDEGGQCAEFEAPKDYNDPSAGTIKLMMSKLPATGERKGAIAGNPGGPGGDALGMFTTKNGGEPEGKVQIPADVREHYDLVAVEPRGLTWGTPLKCQDGISEDPAQMMQMITGPQAQTMHDMCDRSNPGYIQTITTENTARDLDVARAALGEDKLNLYGVSYGGPLMATYATLFPQHTGKSVLDSSVSPQDLWFRLGATRKQARIDGINAMFQWIADHDSEYHLGTTPLQVYRAWSGYVRKHYNVTLPSTPQGAQPGDVDALLAGSSLPAGSSVGNAPVIGQAAVDLINAVEFAQWRSGTFMDAMSTFGDLTRGMDIGQANLLITAGMYSEKAWPHVAETIRDDKAPEDPAAPGDMSEERMNIEMQKVQNMSILDRTIICNENATAPDLSRIQPLQEAMFTGGDAIRMNEDLLASGQHCAGWPAPEHPFKPVNGDALETKPLNIGYSHDTAVSGSGSPEMAAAMGGDVVTVNGYSHGVLLNDPDKVAGKVSEYFA